VLPVLLLLRDRDSIVGVFFSVPGILQKICQ
jgi:hypothetical protein